MPTLNKLAGPPALFKGFANDFANVASREVLQAVHQGIHYDGAHAPLIACLMWAAERKLGGTSFC